MTISTSTTIVNMEALPIKIKWLNPIHWSTKLTENNLKVTPVGSRESIISWDRLPDKSKVSKIYIQKSGNSEYGWVTIGECTPMNRQEYIDLKANNTFHRHGVEWYRLVLPDVKTIVGPVNSYGYLDEYGSEIARRHIIKLKNCLCGNPCYLFTKLRDGVRCPECWDEYLQKRSRVDCPTCLGTSYVRGYYNPVPIYINFPAESTNMQTEVDGPSNVESKIQCWTGNIPLISNGDVLVEVNDNKMWYVEQVQISTHRRVITKQNLVLNRSTGDDPIWDLIKRVQKEAK